MYRIDEFNVPEKTILNEKPTIAPTAIIKNCDFGIYTEVQAFTHIEDTILNDYSYICQNGQVIYTEIGKFANIASMCRINPGFHPMERPTLHHFTYRKSNYGFDTDDDEEFFHWRKIQKVTIGHDTWIGHGVVIMPGVNIGNGAIIGSNSVVTKDVPSYTITAGSPAKIIRRRFAEDICNELEKIRWWDWDYETIKVRVDDFKDLRNFIWKYAE